jgi:hypothetical protein
MNTAMSTIQVGSVTHHPKLIEQLKRYNISYQEIREGDSVIIQIKARLNKDQSQKEQSLRD